MGLTVTDQLRKGSVMGRREPHAEGNQRPEMARICIPTLRNISEEAFQSAFYEAQDVLAEADSVDLIEVRPGRAFRLRDRWHRRLLFHAAAAGFPSANPGLRRVRLDHGYELFVAVCQNFWDLLYFNAIDDWKSHSKLSVCWLGEFWSKDIQTCPALLRGLNKFDVVFVNSWCAVEPLSKFLGRKCHFLPMAVDAFRFCPAPQQPPLPRQVDVYSVGRRCEGVHNEFLRASSEKSLFYIFDSLRSMARVDVIDHREHRTLLANIAKRSKFFLVSPAKMNRPDETQGQLEVGARYFEGAAAGAVMLGQRPHGEAFQEMFPWADAVVEILPDGSDALKVIAELTSDAARLKAISARNMAESLQRHDWIHRWMTIFQMVGVKPSAGMTARVDRLRTMADQVAKAGNAVEPQSAGALRVLIGRDEPPLCLQQASGAAE